jgi:hypothetical protein
VTDPLIPGLVAACDDPRIFGVELTPVQRRLLEEVEAGGLLRVWALGRRSGKTLMLSIIGLWCAVLRPELARHTRNRERRYSVVVATNARQARVAVRQAAEIAEGSPFLSGLVDSVTEDEVRFKVRSSFVAFPCTSRGGRGWPVAFLGMDEAAHFLDGDGNAAAEPVYRALSPSVAQFGEEARIVVASSPFGVDGFFADLFGLVDRGDLGEASCARISTMDARPGFATAALELERARDPEGFRAEYLAEFVVAGGAFLDPARLVKAVGRPGELMPGEVKDPVGAIDLGFVRDSTALAIVGRDMRQPRRLRLVLARSWKPELGPLGFGPTLDEIADLCLEHRVRQVFTDQHSATAAVEYLARRGVHASVVPTTAQSKSRMFSDLKTRVYGDELELYEQPELLAELRRVETVTTPGQATVRIRRLGSSHGDLATALALVCSRIRGTGQSGSISVPTGRIPGVRIHRDPVAEALARAGVSVWNGTP